MSATFGTWEELRPADQPNTFVCRCVRCGTETELKTHSYRSYGVQCRVCNIADERLGIFKGHNLLEETFGHWKPVERLSTGEYQCQCTECGQISTLKLNQFYYYHKKCTNCHPPRYKITPGAFYGDWQALDTTGHVRCRYCKEEHQLKIIQLAYSSCRKRCKCQYQGPHKDSRKPNWHTPVIGDTYGIWKIKASHNGTLFVCECIHCHFERLLVGYRVVYPKYAPRCHNCPKVREAVSTCSTPAEPSQRSYDSPGSKQT